MGGDGAGDGAVSAYQCRDCGGDVERRLVGGLVVYRHAVKGIDHGPLPAVRSAQELLGDAPASTRLPVGARRVCACGCRKDFYATRCMRCRYDPRLAKPWSFNVFSDHRVDKSAGAFGCWPWMGSRDPDGYAKLGDRRLSRVVAANSLGRELSPGELACHRCDNPPCLNPAHLFVGTHTDNQLDMIAKGRAGKNMRPREFCKRGIHPLTGANLGSGRRCKACRTAARLRPATSSRSLVTADSDRRRATPAHASGH